MKALVLLSLIVLPSLSFAGAKVCIDHEKNEINVRAHYYFYGPESYARNVNPCIEEINRMFNKGFLLQLNKVGPWRKVKFNVTGESINYADALRKAKDVKDLLYNFVRVDTPPKDAKAFAGINYRSQHARPGNSGYFLPQDDLGSSTTCAHEFAHGLGLEHIKKCDDRGKGVPSIMAARGCKVDPIYQYDPKAKAGHPGGTVNPRKREVTNRDITNLNLGDLDYRWVNQSQECAYIGRQPRIQDHKGETVKHIN